MFFRAFVILLGFGFALLPARAIEGSDPKLAQDTFVLINQYRKANDLPPLEWNAAIEVEARQHSREMANHNVSFGHEGFGDRMHHLRDALSGMRGGGENVFMTDDPQSVARSAVASWLKSPPHLHNIRGSYNASAIGVWENGQGVIYFTQIFAEVDPAAGP